MAQIVLRARQILPALYRLRLGVVNAFLIEDEQDLVLIDSGYPGYAGRILRAAESIGTGRKKLRHVIVTHSHLDHSGSLAEIKRHTAARAYMHPLDAALVRVGETRRPWQPTPGLLNSLLFQVFVKYVPKRIAAAEIDVEVNDGDRLPLAGGLRVIHMPGHCAGQIALLWERHGGVLFAGDSAMNIPYLRLSIVHENLEQGRASLRKLAALPFEHACFGHGPPLLGGANRRIARRFGA